MVGKDCVAIASDLRLGNQALLVACNFEKVSPRSKVELELGYGGGMGQLDRGCFKRGPPLRKGE